MCVSECVPVRSEIEKKKKKIEKKSRNKDGYAGKTKARKTRISEK